MGESTESECIFCLVARGEVPSDFIYEDSEIVAFNDIQRQAPVHVLVIPRRHVASAADLGEDADLAGRLLTAAVRIAADQGISGTGYRIVTNHGRDGAQSVQHLHLHVVGGRQLRGSLG